MGRNTGRKKRGLLVAPHQHMPDPIAWAAWRFRQRRPPKTMGQIAQCLKVGDPRNPTQIKRWVADCERYLQTPAGHFLRTSPSFISGTVPTLTLDLEEVFLARQRDKERRALDTARAGLARK